MGALLQRMKEWWAGADRTQRMISAFGAAFLVILIAATVMLSSKTRMEPVAPGATPAEQSAIRDAVVSYGFPASFENGLVMAPAKNIPEIRAKLAQDGKLASGGPKGFELLSEGSMFATPAQEAERIKFAAQGELAKTIMKYQGVQDAIVHINGGRKSAFADEGDPATAVVTISPKPGFELTSRDGKAISQIVQLAVAGMKPEGVSVIANTGQILYDGAEANSGDAIATRKIEAEASESKRRERDLQRRLDQAFGSGATIAMVQVELNMDEISKEEETHTPTRTPVTRTSTTENLSGDTPSTGTGPSGGEANILSSPPSNGSGNKNYVAETSDEQYAVDSTHTTTKKAAGEVESLNVNVLVDTKKIQEPDSVKNFVDGLLTTSNERNFKATVTEAEFSNDAAKLAEKAAGGAASANMMQQVMGLLPIAALLVVGIILAKSLTSSLKTKPQPQTTLALADGGTLSLPYSASLEALIGGDTESAGSPLGPMLALAAPDSDDLAEEGDDSPEFIGQIKQRINVPLEQIRRLSKEKPEMVALLLKTWMMDEI